MSSLTAKTLVFAFVLLGQPAHAKSDPEINTQISIGENVARFRIYEKGSLHYFSFSDSFGKSANGSLSESGYEFVLKKANDVFAFTSEETVKCERNSMSVKITRDGKSVQRNGCLNSGSAISKKLNQLVNRLQLLL